MKALATLLFLTFTMFVWVAETRAQECASSSAFAGAKSWFINSEPIKFKDRIYNKYGLPRVLAPTDVVAVGDVQGSIAFAEPSAKAPIEVIYLPVRERCEFQPYVIEPLPACDIATTINAKRTGRGALASYTFTAMPKVAPGKKAPKGKKAAPAAKLNYKWVVELRSSDGTLFGDDPAKYVKGGTSAKMLKVSTKGLPPKGRIEVKLTIEPAAGGCTPTEVRQQVTLP